MALRSDWLPTLAAFESAARHQNFAHAAEELHLTASAVSHHVRKLEARLGVALLLAGVGLRALMERATRAHRTTWREVWHQRSAWVPGYPAAREPLFGR